MPGWTTRESFNEVARASAAVTARLLTAANREYLQEPAGRARSRVSPLTEICHGTPFDEDAYVFDEMDAVYALRAATRPLCLFGHTHAPFGGPAAGLKSWSCVDVSPGERDRGGARRAPDRQRRLGGSAARR